MKNIIIDLDGTITIDEKDKEYYEKEVNLSVVKKLKIYKKNGFKIIVFTARNMNTFKGDLAKISKFTLPIIEDWLQKNDVPYDQIIIGKPWCGFDGFYVDDKSVRPDEFVNLSYEEIGQLIK